METFLQGDRVRYTADMAVQMGEFSDIEGVVTDTSYGDQIEVLWNNGDRVLENVEDLERLRQPQHHRNRAASRSTSRYLVD